jgi:hypothetical protein
MAAVGPAWLAGSFLLGARSLHQAVLVVALVAFPAGRVRGVASWVLVGLAVVAALCGQSKRPENAELTSVSAGQSGCGAPRRNRTGDPVLTMEPPETAVRNPVFAGRARPSGSKVSVLFRRSYVFSMTGLLSSRQTDHDRRLRSGASVSTMKGSSFPLVAPPVGWPPGHSGPVTAAGGQGPYREGVIPWMGPSPRTPQCPACW